MAVAPPLPQSGLDFGLSEEQEILRREVRRFAEERIRPGAAARDAERRFPAEIVSEMGALGLLGMLVDEEYGGAGFDALSYVVAVEELARVCPATAGTMSVTNSVCCWPIGHFGSEGLKRRILPELASGRVLGGFGLTEPEAGSDAGSLKTRAERAGDSWVLDGEKAWITNAGVASWFVVMARTDPGAEKGGITAFVVAADSPGLQIGSPEAKMGLRAAKTAPLLFNRCKVPAENQLGELGAGFKIALATLDHSRLGIAAQAVGIHQRALELAVAYSRERVQFGKPIAQHQAIRFKIAQMATELEAARVLTRSAAVSTTRASAGRLASQAKLFASEAANRACYESLQIHGGNGFSDEYEISKLYRDVRVTAIYEGTSEMQRWVISRQLLRD
ncbi:MAG: acyl-CoA dehydrogenase family protein [Acidobacteriota bacterium]|nr:acyl-CoA dehydrogenase family protein [Acidobacteriota bacterium]